jgi:hypothetical protein
MIQPVVAALERLADPQADLRAERARPLPAPVAQVQPADRPAAQKAQTVGLRAVKAVRTEQVTAGQPADSREQPVVSPEAVTTVQALRLHLRVADKAVRVAKSVRLAPVDNPAERARPDLDKGAIPGLHQLAR